MRENKPPIISVEMYFDRDGATECMHAQHVDMVLNTQDERRGICTGRVRGLFPLLLPFITDVFSGVSYASTLRYAFSNLQRGMHTAVSSVC